MPEEVEGHPKGTVDSEVLRKVTNELTELLKKSEFSSGQLLDENKVLLQTAFGDDFKKISKAVQSFDFEQALQFLNEALLEYDDVK